MVHARNSYATNHQSPSLTPAISSPSSEAGTAPTIKLDAFSLLHSMSRQGKADPQTWQKLLEGGLPHDLRVSSADADAAPYEIKVTAELLLAAQGTVRISGGVDLLYQLGTEQRRWPAAIWIIKRLIDSYGSQALKSNSLRQVSTFWNVEESLEWATGNGFHEILASGDFIKVSSDRVALDQITGDKADDLVRDDAFAHRVLGQVWRSLGLMTAACAGKEMQPELLEMIAHLHHMGMMPVSIYNQTPSKDSMSLQQPPSMNLLSSRMLVSLSDAAWRARERSLAEDAIARGDHKAIPRSRYKINVGGLRPEAWLELLLWSSLHGGWVRQGAEILQHICDSTDGWEPFSWRSVVPTADRENPDWEKLGHIFNTRLPSSMDDAKTSTEISVQRTVSSEVVNAYVDALISSTRMGVGARGISPVLVVEYLVTLKRFLERSDLCLVAGSWDTVVSRLTDLHEHLLDRPYHFQMLNELSPVIGAELGSTRRGDAPDYIFDGSAAVIGLFHRAIRSRISAGSSREALPLFRLMLLRADANKERSMNDIVKNFMSAERAHKQPGLFSSNFAGIAYPGFELQIPPTILGPLLDLAVDAGALAFARWLIYSKEVDGPVIPLRLYTDPAIAPALVRFAADTNDKPLLSKIVDAYRAVRGPGASALPHRHLRSFFIGQVMRKSWRGARFILHRMLDDKRARLETGDLAHLARAVLVEQGAAQTGEQNAQQSFDQALSLFGHVMQLCHKPTRSQITTDQPQLAVLLLVLARAEQYWATYWTKYRTSDVYYTFDLPTHVFNTLLQGIVSAYGSSAGRQVLGTFWPHELRNKQSRGRRIGGVDAGEPIVPRFEPPTLDDERRMRRIVTIGSDPKHHVVLYGGLSPDSATMRIVFDAAVQEFKSSGQRLQPDELILARDHGKRRYDQSASGMLVWAIRRLQEMHVRDEDIVKELRAVLSDEDVAAIESRLTQSEGPERDTDDGTTAEVRSEGGVAQPSTSA